jgi:uncharacterized protein YukE
MPKLGSGGQFVGIPLPDTWNNAIVNVNAQEVNTCVSMIDMASTEIANALSDIINSLSNLKLSWVGQSSELMTEYNDLWALATTLLFGTQSDPSKGALNQLSQTLSSAMNNYSTTEQAITESFNKFRNALNTTGGSSGPQSVVDAPYGTPAVYHTTSVNETY